MSSPLEDAYQLAARDPAPLDVGEATLRHLGIHVGVLVAKAGCNAVLQPPRDIVDVVILHACGPHEVCNALGGFDVWRAREGGPPALVGVDVSADVAAQYFIDDYRQQKENKE
jgi:hypothetical protein